VAGRLLRRAVPICGLAADLLRPVSNQTPKQGRAPSLKASPVRVLEPLPAGETAAGNRSFPRGGWLVNRNCRLIWSGNVKRRQMTKGRSLTDASAQPKIPPPTQGEDGSDETSHYKEGPSHLWGSSRQERHRCHYNWKYKYLVRRASPLIPPLYLVTISLCLAHSPLHPGVADSAPDRRDYHRYRYGKPHSHVDQGLSLEHRANLILGHHASICQHRIDGGDAHNHPHHENDTQKSGQATQLQRELLHLCELPQA
jgi:hypothetical protein